MLLCALEDWQYSDETKYLHHLFDKVPVEQLKVNYKDHEVRKDETDWKIDSLGAKIVHCWR